MLNECCRAILQEADSRIVAAHRGTVQAQRRADELQLENTMLRERHNRLKLAATVASPCCGSRMGVAVQRVNDGRVLWGTYPADRDPEDSANLPLRTYLMAG